MGRPKKGLIAQSAMGRQAREKKVKERMGEVGEEGIGDFAMAQHNFVAR